MAPVCHFTVRYSPGRNHPQSRDQNGESAAGNFPPSAVSSSNGGWALGYVARVSTEGSGCMTPYAFKRLKFPVTILRGSHPFPSRTRKLSLAGPMVLRAQVRGRLGDRRNNIEKPLKET